MNGLKIKQSKKVWAVIKLTDFFLLLLLQGCLPVLATTLINATDTPIEIKWSPKRSTGLNEPIALQAHAALDTDGFGDGDFEIVKADGTKLHFFDVFTDDKRNTKYLVVDGYKVRNTLFFNGTEFFPLPLGYLSITQTSAEKTAAQP